MLPVFGDLQPLLSFSAILYFSCSQGELYIGSSNWKWQFFLSSQRFSGKYCTKYTLRCTRYTRHNTVHTDHYLQLWTQCIIFLYFYSVNLLSLCTVEYIFHRVQSTLYNVYSSSVNIFHLLVQIVQYNIWVPEEKAQQCETKFIHLGNENMFKSRQYTVFIILITKATVKGRNKNTQDVFPG